MIIDVRQDLLSFVGTVKIYARKRITYNLFGAPFGIKIAPFVRQCIILSNKWGAVHVKQSSILHGFIFFCSF